MASVGEGDCHKDPNFAVICSFFDKYSASLGLPEVSYTELQKYLEDTSTDVSNVLIDIHVKLLRRIGKSTVTAERFEKNIIKFIHHYSEFDAWEVESYGYKHAKLDTKLRILKNLLECQFDYNVKFKEKVNESNAEDMRFLPIGRDKEGQAYWYFLDKDMNLLVYKEEQDDDAANTWQLVCSDRQDLAKLVNALQNGAHNQNQDKDKPSPTDSLSSKEESSHDKEGEKKEVAVKVEENGCGESSTGESKERFMEIKIHKCDLVELTKQENQELKAGSLIVVKKEVDETGGFGTGPSKAKKSTADKTSTIVDEAISGVTDKKACKDGEEECKRTGPAKGKAIELNQDDECIDAIKVNSTDKQIRIGEKTDQLSVTDKVTQGTLIPIDHVDGNMEGSSPNKTQPSSDTMPQNLNISNNSEKIDNISSKTSIISQKECYDSLQALKTEKQTNLSETSDDSEPALTSKLVLSKNITEKMDLQLIHDNESITNKNIDTLTENSEKDSSTMISDVGVTSETSVAKSEISGNSATYGGSQALSEEQSEAESNKKSASELHEDVRSSLSAPSTEGLPTEVTTFSHTNKDPPDKPGIEEDIVGNKKESERISDEKSLTVNIVDDSNQSACSLGNAELVVGTDQDLSTAREKFSIDVTNTEEKTMEDRNKSMNILDHQVEEKKNVTASEIKSGNTATDAKETISIEQDISEQTNESLNTHKIKPDDVPSADKDKSTGAPGLEENKESSTPIENMYVNVTVVGEDESVADLQLSSAVIDISGESATKEENFCVDTGTKETSIYIESQILIKTTFCSLQKSEKGPGFEQSNTETSSLEEKKSIIEELESVETVVEDIEPMRSPPTKNNNAIENWTNKDNIETSPVKENKCTENLTAEDNKSIETPIAEEKRSLGTPSTKDMKSTETPSTEVKHCTETPSTEVTQFTQSPSTEDNKSTETHSTKYKISAKNPSTEETKSTETHATEDTKPTDTHSTKDTNSTKVHSTENKKSTKKFSTENTKPTETPSTEVTNSTETPSTENTKSTKTLSAEGTKSTETFSTEDARSTETLSTEGTKSTEALSTEDTKSTVTPSSEDTKSTEALSAEDTKSTETPSSEDTKSTEALSTEDTKSTETLSSEDTKSTETHATEDTKPTDTHSTKDTNSTKIHSTENKKSTKKFSTENTKPTETPSTEVTNSTETPSTENTKSTKTLSAEGTKPTETFSTEDARSTETLSTEGTKSTEALSTEDTKSTETPSTEDTKSTEALSTEDTKSTVTPSSEDTKSTEALSTEDIKSTETPSSEDTKSTEALSTEDTKSTEALSTEDTKSTETPSTEDTKSTEALSTEDTKSTVTPSSEDTKSTEALSTEDIKSTETPSSEDTKSTEALSTEDIKSTETPSSEDTKSTEALSTEDIKSIKSSSTIDNISLELPATENNKSLETPASEENECLKISTTRDTPVETPTFEVTKFTETLTTGENKSSKPSTTGDKKSEKTSVNAENNSNGAHFTETNTASVAGKKKSKKTSKKEQSKILKTSSSKDDSVYTPVSEENQSVSENNDIGSSGRNKSNTADGNETIGIGNTTNAISNCTVIEKEVVSKDDSVKTNHSCNEHSAVLTGETNTAEEISSEKTGRKRPCRSKSGNRKTTPNAAKGSKKNDSSLTTETVNSEPHRNLKRSAPEPGSDEPGDSEPNGKRAKQTAKAQKSRRGRNAAARGRAARMANCETESEDSETPLSQIRSRRQVKAAGSKEGSNKVLNDQGNKKGSEPDGDENITIGKRAKKKKPGSSSEPVTEEEVTPAKKGRNLTQASASTKKPTTSASNKAAKKSSPKAPAKTQKEEEEGAGVRRSLRVRQLKAKRPPTPSSQSEGSDGEEDTEEDKRDQDFFDSSFTPEEESGDEEFKPKGRNFQRQAARTGHVNDEEVVNDDTPCVKCGKYNHPEMILLCDKCDAGYHTACLRPPLMLIPDGDWFCPPCEHLMLITKLLECLQTLDNAMKKKDRLHKRQERLAFVGINISNILHGDRKSYIPGKTVEDDKECQNNESDANNDSRSSESSESESPKRTFRSERLALRQAQKRSRHEKHKQRRATRKDSPEGEVLTKRTCRLRNAVSYQFKEFDELISNAIEDDKPCRREKPPGIKRGIRRGKDMSNILGASDEEDEKIRLRDGDSGGPPPVLKKRTKRKLTKLDSDEDPDEDDESEEFRLSEAENTSDASEAEEEDEDASTSNLDSGDWKPKKTWYNSHSPSHRPKRKAKSFVIDDDEYESEENSSKRRSTRNSNRGRIHYNVWDSEDDETEEEQSTSDFCSEDSESFTSRKKKTKAALGKNKSGAKAKKADESDEHSDSSIARRRKLLRKLVKKRRKDTSDSQDTEIESQDKKEKSSKKNQSSSEDTECSEESEGTDESPKFKKKNVLRSSDEETETEAEKVIDKPDCDQLEKPAAAETKHDIAKDETVVQDVTVQKAPFKTEENEVKPEVVPKSKVRMGPKCKQMKGKKRTEKQESGDNSNVVPSDVPDKVRKVSDQEVECTEEMKSPPAGAKRKPPARRQRGKSKEGSVEAAQPEKSPHLLGSENVPIESQRPVTKKKKVPNFLDVPSGGEESDDQKSNKSQKSSLDDAEKETVKLESTPCAQSQNEAPANYGNFPFSGQQGHPHHMQFPPNPAHYHPSHTSEEMSSYPQELPSAHAGHAHPPHSRQLTALPGQAPHFDQPRFPPPHTGMSPMHQAGSAMRHPHPSYSAGANPPYHYQSNMSQGYQNQEPGEVLNQGHKAGAHSNFPGGPQQTKPQPSHVHGVMPQNANFLMGQQKDLAVGYMQNYGPNTMPLPQEMVSQGRRDLGQGSVRDMGPGHLREIGPGNVRELGPRNIREMGPRHIGPGNPREMGPGLSREMGPGHPREMGPGHPREMGPGHPREMGPGHPREMGPGHPREMRPGHPREMGPGQLREMGLGNAREMGPGQPREKGPGNAGEMGPGHPRQMGPGQPREIGPGNVREMKLGHPREMGPDNAREMGPGHTREMGPGNAREMGPGHPREMGPGNAREMGPGHPREMGPGNAREMRPGHPREMGPGNAREMGPGHTREMGPGNAREMGPGHTREMGPGNAREMGPGHTREMGPGNAREMGPGHTREMGPGNAREMGPGHTREMGPGNAREMGPGHIREMGPGHPREMGSGNAREMGPGHPSPGNAREMGPGHPREMGPGNAREMGPGNMQHPYYGMQPPFHNIHQHYPPHYQGGMPGHPMSSPLNSMGQMTKNLGHEQGMPTSTFSNVQSIDGTKEQHQKLISPHRQDSEIYTPEKGEISKFKNVDVKEGKRSKASSKSKQKPKSTNPQADVSDQSVSASKMSKMSMGEQDIAHEKDVPRSVLSGDPSRNPNPGLVGYKSPDQAYGSSGHMSYPMPYAAHSQHQSMPMAHMPPKHSSFMPPTAHMSTHPPVSGSSAFKTEMGHAEADVKPIITDSKCEISKQNLSPTEQRPNIAYPNAPPMNPAKVSNEPPPSHQSQANAPAMSYSQRFSGPSNVQGPNQMSAHGGYYHGPYYHSYGPPPGQAMHPPNTWPQNMPSYGPRMGSPSMYPYGMHPEAMNQGYNMMPKNAPQSTKETAAANSSHTQANPDTINTQCSKTLRRSGSVSEEDHPPSVTDKSEGQKSQSSKDLSDSTKTINEGELPKDAAIEAQQKALQASSHLPHRPQPTHSSSSSQSSDAPIQSIPESSPTNIPTGTKQSVHSTIPVSSAPANSWPDPVHYQHRGGPWPGMNDPGQFRMMQPYATQGMMGGAPYPSKFQQQPAHTNSPPEHKAGHTDARAYFQPGYHGFEPGFQPANCGPQLQGQDYSRGPQRPDFNSKQPYKPPTQEDSLNLSADQSQSGDDQSVEANAASKPKRAKTQKKSAKEGGASGRVRSAKGRGRGRGGFMIDNLLQARGMEGEEEGDDSGEMKDIVSYVTTDDYFKQQTSS